MTWIRSSSTGLISLALAVLAASAIAVVFLLVSPLPPRTIAMSTGPESGVYFRTAQRYRALLAEEGYTLEVEPGAGSINTLEALIAGDAMIGFVQGGAASDLDTSNLRSIASLFYEPVWVFYHAQSPIERLSDLRGLRVSVGANGSGTQPVARDLLLANGISTDNTEILFLNNETAVDQLAGGFIDAAIVVISPQAEVVKDMLSDENIELLNFRRGRAYESQFSYLSQVVIGEGMIDLSQNLPDRDVTVPAVAASLVVRDDISTDLIRLFVRKAQRIHRRAGPLEFAGEFPSSDFVDIPLHSTAIRYLENPPSWLERNLPSLLWVSIVERVIVLAIPFVTVIYPLLRGIPPLYVLGIQLRMTRWYRLLRHIEETMQDMTPEEINIQIEHLRRVQKEISQQLSLPSLFLSNLYTLKIHIRLVIARLEEQRVELLTSERAD